MDCPLNILDLTHTFADKFLKNNSLKTALSNLGGFIGDLGRTLGSDFYELVPDVWVHKSANVFNAAYIGGNCIIGAKCEVRHGAFIRGNALIGEGCVIGNSTEIKNAVLFDGVQVPHFNYVGDSILGYKCHLGAGAIISNVKSDKSLIEIYGEKFRKFGAIVGDFAEIGCNCVLNPGTVVGAYTRIYPLNSVRGRVPSKCIYKNKNQIISIN